MPRQFDPSRKPRTARRATTPRTRRAPEDLEHALLRDSGGDAERLRSGLAAVDAHAGQEVVSHLGHEVGNTAMHRVLSHAPAVAQADVPLTITFGRRVNSAAFDPRMRQALETILRKAHLHSAVVSAIGTDTFEVAPASITDEGAFVAAAEAAVGSCIESFRRTPRYAGYHFEIAH